MMKLKSDRGEMITLSGRGVSPGLAKGTAFLYKNVLHRDSELYVIDRAHIDEEKARIDTAIADVRRSLQIDAAQMKTKVGKQPADIFLAQEAILLDSSVIDELKRNIETELINAEQVVRVVFRLYARKFREMDNELFRERGDDIDDLSRRLLLSLAGIHAHSLEKLPENTILVAHRLLPSDTVFLSRSSTVAVLAEFAGPAAHAALLARELGIPCIGGIRGICRTLQTGDVVLVDGTTGVAVVHPDSYALQAHEKSVLAVQQSKKQILRASLSQEPLNYRGHHVSVMANVRSREDVALALRCGADGIGLFRTEPYYLSAKHLPTDREFAEFLYDSLEPARGMHVDVRLLDVGADKNPLYLHLPPESDPFLGRRGIRVLHAHPNLLESQLRGLLTVSRHFDLGILIPMVTTERDVVDVGIMLRRLAAESDIERLPRLGAMIETPAAALSIPVLKKHVDFFSIGTNDLTQYTMAAGRENPLVADYFIDSHQTILRLVSLIVDESGNTPVSLCGEVAARTQALPALLETGIRSFSVSAALVPDVKNAIRLMEP